MNITRSTLSAVAIACIAPSWGVLHGQVDPSGSWRTWRTDHFRVHARTELRESALRTAEEAEWAYQLLARELEPPRGVIELVLSDDVDFSNGFASTFPTNRVTVYLAPPGDPSVSLARYDDWLRLVITHELTHIFHLDRADGLWGMLQTVFGRAPGLFPNVYQPSWVHEGLATYYESRLTNAGRVRGAFHEQLLTAAATDDRWPAPGDAVFANPMWPGGFRPYAWGSRFFEMSEATGRDSVIPRFVDRTSRQLLPVNVSSAWRPLTGESVDDTWRRMRAAAAGAGLRDPDTVLVRGLRSEPMIRLSRDGSRLAYRWRDDRNTQRVVMIRVSDGTRIGVRRANEIHGLAWAADSLYVAQLDFSSPVQIRSDLYRWQPPNSWTRLTRGERVTDAFVTPDRRVGVLVLRRGVRVPMLVGPGSLMPYPAPAGNDWGRVAISPDGRWVAGARHANERWDIVLWSVGEPEDVRLITDDEALDGDPSWTSDGRLVFSSERTGLPQAYLYTLGADDVQQITDVRGGARDPVVAPDGTLFYGTLMADGHAIAATSRVQPVRRAVPSADSRSRPSPLRSPVPSPRE